MNKTSAFGRKGPFEVVPRAERRRLSQSAFGSGRPGARPRKRPGLGVGFLAGLLLSTLIWGAAALITRGLVDLHARSAAEHSAPRPENPTPRSHPPAPASNTRD